MTSTGSVSATCVLGLGGLHPNQEPTVHMTRQYVARASEVAPKRPKMANASMGDDQWVVYRIARVDVPSAAVSAEVKLWGSQSV